MITNYQTVGKIIFGVDAIPQYLGIEVQKLQVNKVLIVTDQGIMQAGIHKPVLKALESAGLEYAVFDEVLPDPAVEVFSKCLERARGQNFGLILGLGGGSSLDIAKSVSIMLNNEGPIESYAGVNLVPNPGIPLGLIPTTAGTGSEVTSISVLSDTQKNVKIGIVSDYMYADFVVLDPVLTLDLPKHITASTGLDALIHAIESYTGKKSNFITAPFAMQSIKLIAQYLRRAYADGSDLEARTGMLQASLLAGMAFSNTQTAGAHACALSLGGSFHLPHGVATSLMLPAVMRYNVIAVPDRFSEIARHFGEHIQGLSVFEAAEKGIQAVERLIADVGFQTGLENYGVAKEDIDKLADGALLAKRLWENNPRTISLEECKNLFACSFNC
mgnify:CR=1 FL=1